MTDIMTHRGPDGEGHWVDGYVALGHRRLSIIDLSLNAAQPMLNADRSVGITFNGEIYNYQDLIPEIERKGYQFISRSDTEVILHLYEIYGEDCINKLRGMFAFAIWDKRRQRLFLARDRIGIKPLYYSANKDYFIFASEIKAIVNTGLCQKNISCHAFSQYMRFLTVPQPESIFSDINKLSPGSYLTVDVNGCMQEKVYWNLSKAMHEINAPTSINDEEYSNRFSSIFSESTRCHMIADVPVGAFLSGGLDSSSVVAMMRDNYPNLEIATFSIVFPEIPSYNEGIYSLSVAEFLKTQHHVYPFNENFLEDFHNIVWYLDEPFAVSSSFATYFLAKGASENVKVVLTGDGGDELLAGYAGYANHYYLRYPEWVFAILTQAYTLLLATEKILRTDSKFGSRILTALARRVGNEGIRYSEQVAQNSLYALSLAFKKDYLLYFLENWNDNLMAYYYNSLSSEDRLLKMLYSSFSTRLVDEMLMKVDRMTMAHSVEARVPLLDHILVEYSFSIPSSLKLRENGNETIGKYLLKTAMRNYLPHEIVYRKKKGFDIPVSKWLKGNFFETVMSRIRNGYLIQNHILDPNGIELLSKEVQRNPEHYSNMLMLLFSFETWVGIYQDRFGPVHFN
jgi:asparagine synthase (glutamine-hydrolysing)